MELFTIPIEPKPQSRPRAGIRGRHATVYEDSKMMRWRKDVTEYVKQNYCGEYFDGAIKIDVTFYLKAPQSLSKEPSQRAKEKTRQKYLDFVNELIYVDKKPDLDNLEKALYDSISKSEIVWSDDNIIVEHTTRKIYSPNPRMEIRIEGF